MIKVNIPRSCIYLIILLLIVLNVISSKSNAQNMNITLGCNYDLVEDYKPNQNLESKNISYDNNLYSTNYKVVEQQESIDDLNKIEIWSSTMSNILFMTNKNFAFASFSIILKQLLL